MKGNNEQIVFRTSRVTLFVNIFLSLLKTAVGFAANSTALIADGVNSISDVLSTIVVMVGIKLAGRKSDKDHPYGHERLESAAALILAVFIIISGLMIGYEGIMKVIAGSAGELEVPGAIALVAALITMAVKESLYWYTKAAAKKTGSSSLLAVAWDHRSDVLSGAGAFVGILGARIGVSILDPIASVVISLLILRLGGTIFRDAIRKMTDTSCDDAFVNEIKELTLAQNDVLGVDRIRTRLFGDKVYVEIEISADRSMTLEGAHDAAQRVHDAIEKKYEKVKHCMVHVNPVERVEASG